MDRSNICEDIKSIKMRDILGYNTIIIVMDKGYSLEEIKEMIKDTNGGTISISIDGNDPIIYESMARASSETGIPTDSLAQYKNKADVIHPITRLRNGKIYVIRFEGFKDKNVEDTRPKKLGKSITLLVNGSDLITYRTLTEASEEIGTSLKLLRYHHYKSQGNGNPKTFKSNGNTYQFCICDRT